MTDTNGLLRDAGGARPRDEVDAEALAQRLIGLSNFIRRMIVTRHWPESDSVGDSQVECCVSSSAALVQLRDHNAQMASDEKILQRALDAERSMRERAEAEVARLTTKCKYGDPMCPCQDGDACHYEGDNPMTPPPIAALKARIADLEAGMNAQATAGKSLYAATELLIAERDGLLSSLDKIVSAYDAYRGKGMMPAPNQYAMLVAAIDAAREKP